MINRTGAAIVMAALAVGAGAIAHADDVAEAKAHFEEGSKLYDLGHYIDAAHEYEAAFKLKPDPALLFNLGQAYRLGGDKPSALRAYRSFLRRAPDAPNRAEVEEQIATLQKAIDEEKQATTSAPAAAPRPAEPPPAATTAAPTPSATTPAPAVAVTATAAPERRPAYKKWWFWTAVVGGVAVVGAGVALAVAYTTPKNAPSPPGTVTLVFP